MSSNEQLVEQLDRLAGAVSAPLDAQALGDGWTPKVQQHFLAQLQELRNRLVADEPLPDVSLSRGLDFAGVTGGDLIEHAAALSNALREHGRRRKAQAI